MWPWNGWNPDSSEPFLTVMSGSFYAFSEGSKEIAEDHTRELMAEGWEDSGHEGVAGYVHVDKPERIKGPRRTVHSSSGRML